MRTWLSKSLFASLALALVCAGCGGGGGQGNPPPPASVTQTIAAAVGGTINGPGGVTLAIPASALAADTSITIALDGTGAPPLPAGITAGGPMLSLTPSGTTFARPVLLSLPIDPALYPANVTPNFIQTNQAGSGWEQIPATRSGDRISVAMAHFTILVALGPCSSGCPPPALSITLNLSVAETGFAFFRVDAIYPTLVSDAFGGTYFSYRWLRDGRSTGAINDRSILIDPVSLTDAGSYTAVVSVRRLDNNVEIASATSPAATLTVTVLPPVITGQPRDVEFDSGGSARFISASTSSVAQTLQWKRCPPGATCPADKSTWMDVNSATNPSAIEPVLRLRSLTAAEDGASFALCAFNVAGPLLDIRFPTYRCSDAGFLRLRPMPVAPELVALSSPGPLLPGDSASFTATATGTDLSYLWQRQDAGSTRWVAVDPPVDAATYTISNVAATDAGAIFRVTVSNAVDSDCSVGPVRLPCSTSGPLVIRPGATLALNRVLAGYGFSVALGGDGRIYTWGRGCDGALGKGDLNDLAMPGPIIGLGGVATFGVGRGHVLTIAGTGAAKAWGDNQHGQGAQLAATITPSCVGDLPTNPARAIDTAPADLSVPGMALLSAVAGGDVHSLALDSTGQVLSWGGDGFLALGDGTVNPRRLDRAAVPFSDVLRVAASGYTSAAVTRSGQLWVWGEGGLGDGSTMVQLRPTPVVTAGDVADVALGQRVALVLLRDGRVFTWGRNTGTPVERVTLRQLPLPGIAVGLTGRGQHALILLADGRVMAWGNNGNGQLGLGNTGTVEVPLQVPGLPRIVAIGTSINHSLALAADGNVWGWGANSFGQASGNPGADVLSPVQVPNLNLN